MPFRPLGHNDVEHQASRATGSRVSSADSGASSSSSRSGSSRSSTTSSSAAATDGPQVQWLQASGAKGLLHVCAGGLRCGQLRLL
eukprot:11669764-Heterocapsa_arctica.AAC.1